MSVTPFKKIMLLILGVCGAGWTQAQTISPTLFSSNVTPELKAQLTSDLNLAHSIQFSKTSPLHQHIFGKPTKSNGYYTWFSKRIKTISVGRCGTESSAVACVIPILTSQLMRVTNLYISMNAPQVARMSVLFHEAKHTEPNPIAKEGDPDLRYWMHAKCPTPFVNEKNETLMSIWTGLELSGKDACDITPIGSYGTVVIMLRNIEQNATNVSEKVKADAALYANDQSIRIIDPTAKDALQKDSN